MHSGKIEGFFGLAPNGSQYRYEADYSADERSIRWFARVTVDGELKGTPSGQVKAMVGRFDLIEHHVRDIVTSSITNSIGVEA